MGVRFIQIYFTWFHTIDNNPTVKIVRSLNAITETQHWYDFLLTWVGGVILAAVVFITVILCCICNMGKVDKADKGPGLI